MRNLMIFTLTAMCSMGALADHHKGDHGEMKHPVKEMFKRADLDGEGSISTQEHEQALAQMTDQRRERFAKMDVNGDGSLTKEEARAAMKERKKKMKEKQQGD